ncbi:exopolyphosphatase [Clostridium cellulovorans]|uniref:Exopolyphosphatase n=1 Tax=Clostridium cellulovorans (strain ATCC 35296 / DSM 3052 / OCM 3 / 743B) TaxID=573061 RepID=D9SSA9_CLOC7|nr:exopolyphosphatase [Clostridium cellulovorans]ADL52556.1 Ppx/GppA phosphatase [Clostridium cellulovorans 743B]
MKKVAIIDIGSNTIRLVIFQIEGEYFRVLDEDKNTARLGKDIEADGSLNPARMKKAVEAMKEFKSLCHEEGVEEIHAFATEAVRKAKNRQQFIENVRQESGIEIRVLNGLEEAFYDYFATVNTLDIEDCLMMDIGGASTEFVLIKNRELVNSISIPFGSINTAEKFQLQETVSKKTSEEFKEFIFREFNKISWLKEAVSLPLVGIGGTMRTLAKIDRKKKAYPIDKIHNYKIESKVIVELFNEVADMDLKSKRKIKGLSKDRADIFMGALSVIRNLIDYCSIKEIVISGTGVREGFTYEYIFKSNKILEDILDYSLNKVISNYPSIYNNGSWVYEKSLQIFSGIKELFYIDNEKKKIMKAAAYLHDIGKEISYTNFHKHTFYMMMNMDIHGLSHIELLLSAYTATLYHKEALKLSLEEKAIISEDMLKDAERIAIVLRIAEKLSRGYNESIKSIVSDFDEEHIYLKINCHSKTEINFYDMDEIKEEFKILFSRELIIISDK